MKLQLIGLLISLSLAQSVAGEDVSSIGYASVSEAFEALKADPGSKVEESDGWIVVSTKENGNYVLWSFTPSSHPAHPAAVKREIVERDGAIHISMNALCEASKTACDALIEEFKHLNEEIGRRIRGGT